MNTLELSLKEIVRQKFLAGETIVSVLETVCSDGEINQVLALVKVNDSTAFFVFLSQKSPPIAFYDLSIQIAVPIDQHFKFNLEANVLYLNIDVGHILSLKLPLNENKNEFVAQLYEAALLTKPVCFNWLDKYSEFKDSPNIAVVRHKIITSGSDVMGREHAVNYHMSTKILEYTDKIPLRIYVATWNVNGQPPCESLVEWLAVDEEPPDIYAIGFQELDLSKDAFLFNITPREDEWRKVVERSLHAGANYRCVKLVRLVGMMLIVYIQEKYVLKKAVQSVLADTVGTGIMGKMGNKGAVGVRMELHNTTICFVNSHLAAHVEEFERRNQDYKEICSRMTFGQQNLTIDDHHHVYWLGDLNYRILTDLDSTRLLDMLEKEDYRGLIYYDQLYRQHAAKNVFKDYIEEGIKFRPTYKYDPGTDDWDSSEKNRAPAWCDRVLYKGEGIRPLEYRSHPQLKLSDHKPVVHTFESDIVVIDQVKYRKTHEEVMKQLDKLENEFLPQATVDRTEVDFGELYFMEPRSKELIIANDGQVDVRFEFIKKLDDTSFCKDWLHIKPHSGQIKPGAKCDIRLEVTVDKRTASRLNGGQDNLYDILVLHLEGGKDIFITVNGNYQRSCFGSSIEALVQVNVPITEIKPGGLVELESNHPPPPGSYYIPKELWFLVDHLYQHGLKKPKLFEERGTLSDFVAIRNWLDVGSIDPLPGGVHAVAEALLLLLDSSAEPVFPFGMHEAAFGCSHSYSQSRQLILRLPELRRNVFLYVCVFLQELLHYSNDNQLDSKTLATIFGTIFLRDPPRFNSSQYNIDKKKSNFVHHFLVNDQSELFNLGR